MFENMTPVNRDRHSKTKIKSSTDFNFAKDIHLAYLTINEFTRAATTYPIVFLDDQSTGEFRPVALLGLEPGKNLFIDASGQWKAPYVPAIIRRYPFALSKTADSENYIVCIDEASASVSEHEGAPMFDEQGNETAVVENVKRYLGELQQMDVLTKQCCTLLAQDNLFTPLNMRVNINNQFRNITGCYVINEERLNNFADHKFTEIRKKGYLPAIYAHLISLAQIDRLAELNTRNLAERNTLSIPTDHQEADSKETTIPEGATTH